MYRCGCSLSLTGSSSSSSWSFLFAAVAAAGPGADAGASGGVFRLPFKGAGVGKRDFLAGGEVIFNPTTLFTSSSTLFEEVCRRWLGIDSPILGRLC